MRTKPPGSFSWPSMNAATSAPVRRAAVQPTDPCHGRAAAQNETTGKVASSGGTSVDDRDRALRTPRYDSLTVWRGIACLLVITYHSGRGPLRDVSGWSALIFGVLGKCWVGVPLFFVISGYCVTASADGLRGRTGAAKYFFWRRFRRIYPPYWAAFAIMVLGVALVDAFAPSGFFQALMMPRPSALTNWQWLGNLSLTETWRWHLTGGAESALLPHSWTLCYEEQFYALVGLVLICARRLFFLALGILTLIVGILLLFPAPGVSTEGLFLDGRWLMFASGTLVYYVFNYVAERGRVWFCLPLVIGVLYAVAGPSQLQQPINQSYLAAFSFALVIMGLRRWDNHARTCAIFRPLRFCGDRCYSLYLVHWPVAMIVGHSMESLGANGSVAVFLIRIPLCVAVTIFLGSIFHSLIERRFWNPCLGPPKKCT